MLLFDVEALSLLIPITTFLRVLGKNWATNVRVGGALFNDWVIGDGNMVLLVIFRRNMTFYEFKPGACFGIIILQVQHTCVWSFCLILENFHNFFQSYHVDSSS